MPEGGKPYSPTRLEWLTLDLAAHLRVPLSESTGYSMDFAAPPGTDGIVISVRYLPSVNREVMNLNIDSARKIIAFDSKVYGWSRWL